MRRLAILGFSWGLGWGLSWLGPSGCARCPEPGRSADPETAVAAAAVGRVASAPERLALRESSGRAEPSVIIFVRHAEKAADGTADPPLTDDGERRARCLATTLRSWGVTHIYATGYRRTRATVEPLARGLGVSVEILDAADGPAWISALEGLPGGSRAVVAGHSNTVPALVQALGGHPGGLDEHGHIPSDDYDRMVFVTRAGGRPVSSVIEYCPAPDAPSTSG